MQIAKQYFDALDKLLVHISVCLFPHLSVVNRHLYGSISIFSVANFGYLLPKKTSYENTIFKDRFYVILVNLIFLDNQMYC